MTARVFVTTYGLYNAGFQFASNETGYWLDCADWCPEDVYDHFITQEQKHLDLLITDVEIMFTDYEGFPADLYSESHIDFDTIYDFENLDEDQQELVEAIVDHGIAQDVKDAIAKREEFHLYDGTLTDYAREVVADTCDIPEWIEPYFDFEAYGNMLSMDGRITELSKNQLLIGG